MRQQAFNHNTPGVPTLTKGMLLGASGVTAPPLGTIGNMSGGFSTAEGNLTDALGLGQFASYPGELYISDHTGNRVQRWVKNSSGVWAADGTSVTGASALGSAVNCNLLAYDALLDQLHIGSSAQNAIGTLIGVWNRSQWPTLTVANRVRSYGTASLSNGTGNLRAPTCLSISGVYSILCSSAGDYRVIMYNHTTGVSLLEKTNSLWKANYVFNSDRSKLYSGSQATDTELGLWLINQATLGGTSRLDYASGGTFARSGSLQQSSGGDASDLAYYATLDLVLVRGFTDGRIQGWRSSDNAFVAEFTRSGGAGTTKNLGATSVSKPNNIQQMKIGIAFGTASQSDDLVCWASNAKNGDSQSFVLVFPISIATAVWQKTGWPAGTNTIEGIAIDGVNLGAEKYKIELSRDNSTWITVVAGQLLGSAFTSAISAIGTFLTADVLYIRLSMSTFSRLDGNAIQGAVNDKLAPENVSLIVSYSNSNDDNEPPASTAYEGDKIALETRLKNTTGLAGVLIKNTNAKTADPETADFIACAVTYGQAQEASLGGDLPGDTTTLRRYTGSFFVQIFVQEGKGGGSAVRLADVVADRFRGQTFASGTSRIRCYTPLLQEIGPDGKGHFQINVAIPFKRDTQH